jgi:hypothetical protein
MADAQRTLTQATKNLAEAQSQLGAAAAAGSAQAVAVIAEYTTASTAAAAAVAELTAATAAQNPVMAENAAVTTAATAATNAFGISGRQVGTAVIGGLEGRFMSANRAAGAFLSTTLGLGPVLQAAFPVIGALALGEVLVDIAKNAYEAYEKFVSIDSVWEKLDDDVRKMQDRDFINVHSIETATERLDKANDAASALRDTAEQIHKTGIGDLVSGLLSGNIGALAAAAGELSGAHGAAEASAERTKQSIELQAKVISDQHELNVLKIDAAHAADAALTPEQKITAEYEKRVALAREEQRYNEQRDRLFGNATPASGGSQELALKESAAGGEAYAARVELNKKAVAEFVSESIADYKRLEAESKQITEAITNAWEESNKADIEAQKQADEQAKKAMEERQRDHEQDVRAAQEAARVAIEAANTDYEATSREIREQEQLGEISHRVALQRLLDAEKLKEQATTGALGKESEVFNPIEGGRELQEFTKVEDEITAVARKAQAEREKLTQQETQKFMQQWKQAANEFNRDFTTAFNSLLTKQESAEKAFGHMFGQIELQLVDFVAQWLLKQGELWLMNEILQASGLATQQGKQTAANTATVTGDAGVAAAGTMAYYSAINPPIAPAMASLAFAETMAFAAFEHGGMVMGPGGSPVPIIAHAGERVLSAGQTSNFESLVNNGGNRSATLNQENHFGGGVTEDMLAAHTQQTMSQLRGMLRPEAFR